MPILENTNKYAGGLGQVIVGTAALILAIWSYHLQKQSSAQAQKIEGFSALIKTESNQLDSLSNAISILNKQLLLSEQAQRDANKNFELVRHGNANKLLNAAIALYELNQQPEHDTYSHVLNEQQRISYMRSALSILEGQANNPYLLENDTMAQDWMDSYCAAGSWITLNESHKTLYVGPGTLPMPPDRFDDMRNIIFLTACNVRNWAVYAYEKKQNRQSILTRYWARQKKITPKY